MSEREEYTPDTGAVRAAYTRAMRQAFITSTSEHIEEFDRWLAAHEQELRERIAREIEADIARRERDFGITEGCKHGMTFAARIARVEGSV